MASGARKNLRKLVTLTPELLDRVEAYRTQSLGGVSESEALRSLIEDGLKMRDRPEDLFERCKAATASGEGISEVLALVTSGHPLISRTVVETHEVSIYLKTPPAEPEERFVFYRPNRHWSWLISEGYDQWRELNPPHPPRLHGKVADTDDDIPF